MPSILANHGMPTFCVFSLQEGTTKVIYAYHPSDPASENEIPKHPAGARGARSVMLLSSSKAPGLPSNMSAFDVLNNQVSGLWEGDDDDGGGDNDDEDDDDNDDGGGGDDDDDDDDDGGGGDGDDDNDDDDKDDDDDDDGDDDDDKDDNVVDRWWWYWRWSWP